MILYLNYLLIGVTCSIWGIIYKNVSKLPRVIIDNKKRIEAVNNFGESNCKYNCHFCYFMLQTKKICNFLIFCQIFMIFLPKYRTLYVVLEKGHGTGKKGHGAREKGHGATPC